MKATTRPREATSSKGPRSQGHSGLYSAQPLKETGAGPGLPEARVILGRIPVLVARLAQLGERREGRDAYSGRSRPGIPT